MFQQYNFYSWYQLTILCYFIILLFIQLAYFTKISLRFSIHKQKHNYLFQSHIISNILTKLSLFYIIQPFFILQQHNNSFNSLKSQQNYKFSLQIQSRIQQERQELENALDIDKSYSYTDYKIILQQYIQRLKTVSIQQYFTTALQLKQQDIQSEQKVNNADIHPRCSQCHTLLRRCLTLTPCDHTLCENCIKNYLIEQKSYICPVCREPIYSVGKTDNLVSQIKQNLIQQEGFSGNKLTISQFIGNSNANNTKDDKDDNNSILNTSGGAFATSNVGGSLNGSINSGVGSGINISGTSSAIYNVNDVSSGNNNNGNILNNDNNITNNNNGGNNNINGNNDSRNDTKENKNEGKTINEDNINQVNNNGVNNVNNQVLNTDSKVNNTNNANTNNNNTNNNNDNKNDSKITINSSNNDVNSMLISSIKNNDNNQHDQQNQQENNNNDKDNKQITQQTIQQYIQQDKQQQNSQQQNNQQQNKQHNKFSIQYNEQHITNNQINQYSNQQQIQQQDNLTMNKQKAQVISSGLQGDSLTLTNNSETITTMSNGATDAQSEQQPLLISQQDEQKQIQRQLNIIQQLITNKFSIPKISPRGYKISYDNACCVPHIIYSYSISFKFSKPQKQCEENLFELGDKINIQIRYNDIKKMNKICSSVERIYPEKYWWFGGNENSFLEYRLEQIAIQLKNALDYAKDIKKLQNILLKLVIL